jgi:hypothetical protein
MGADTLGDGLDRRGEARAMRQWELFGITDSDPNWTPPKRSEPPKDEDDGDLVEVISVLSLAIDAQDERLPEPAA